MQWPGISTFGRPSSRSKEQEGTVLQETFAPILYVLRYTDLEQAIALNNACFTRPFVVDLHDPI